MSRIFTRRAALAVLGGAGAVLFAAGARRAASPDDSGLSCTPRPAQTEGPFFSDRKLERSDIRADPAGGPRKAGIPLQLMLNVGRIVGAGCAPLAGARVDLWQCDALGVYSDFQADGIPGESFLRGYQTTDAKGVVRFTTIYPGWYPGRAVHLHFKIRSAGAAGRMQEFTSQLYFDDRITDEVHALAPYASRGQRDVRNVRDGLYRRGGDQLLLALRPSGVGYAGELDIGLPAV
jgi:protocatechuate 3,4-dioxygenase beta subunit